MDTVSPLCLSTFNLLDQGIQFEVSLSTLSEVVFHARSCQYAACGFCDMGVWVLLGSVGGQSQSQHQSQTDDSNPWRQIDQWENNGRVFSLLNSGAEYVPARAQERSRNPECF